MPIAPGPTQSGGMTATNCKVRNLDPGMDASVSVCRLPGDAVPGCER